MKRSQIIRAIGWATAILLMLAILRQFTAFASTGTKPVVYGGETVTEVYSFDRPNRAYHPVSSAEDIAAAVKAVRGLSTSDRFRSDSVGFLLFTETGRHAFYASPSSTSGGAAAREMIALSQDMNDRYPASAQWLAYMDVENIARIEFSGGAGGERYSNDATKYPADFSVTVNTTDRDEIARIAAYVKRLEVDPKPRVHKKADEWISPTAAAGMYRMTIHFVSGTQYHLFGDFLTISTNDMSEQISYSGKREEIRGLRDLMAGLPSAKRQAYP